MNGNGNANKPDITSYISPSRLKLWLRCPLSFRLRYVDGVVTPSNPNLFLGHVVHRALEHYYRNRTRDVTLYPEAVADHIRKIWQPCVDDGGLTFQTKDEEEKLQAQALSLVRAYLEEVDGEERPLSVEERFEAPLVDPGTGEDLGIPLVGILDLVLECDDGPIILDFKTAARSSARVDVLHELQLTCYSYVFRQVTGRSEAGLEIRSLIKTKTPKVERERYEARGDIHFDRLFSVIRAYLEAIRSQQYHIRPGFECSFCDYQARCAAT